MKFIKLASYLLISAVLIIPKAYAASDAADAPVQFASLRAWVQSPFVQTTHGDLMNPEGALDLSRLVTREHDFTIQMWPNVDNPDGNLMIDMSILSEDIQLTVLARGSIMIGPEVTITTGSGNVYLMPAHDCHRGSLSYHTGQGLVPSTTVIPGNPKGTVIADPGASIIHLGTGMVYSYYRPQAVAPTFGNPRIWG